MYRLDTVVGMVVVAVHMLVVIVSVPWAALDTFAPGLAELELAGSSVAGPELAESSVAGRCDRSEVGRDS